MSPAPVLFALLSQPLLSPPQLWSFGFAAPPRIPLVGDANGDGFADLLCVYPPGASIVDIQPNVDGLKTGFGRQARTSFGADCLAATTIDADGDGHVEVVGVFPNGEILSAGSMAEGVFSVQELLAKLPEPITDPIIGEAETIEGRAGFFVVSKSTGNGFGVRTFRGGGASVRRLEFPAHINWIAQREIDATRDGAEWVYRTGSGETFVADSANIRKKRLVRKGSATEAIAIWNGKIVVGDTVYDNGIAQRVDSLATFEPGTRLLTGDMDGDETDDLVAFSYGTGKHTAYDVHVLYALREGDRDLDRDGLSNEEEAALRTDPENRDTDNDGLLDGWETKGFRELDLPGLGCSPTRPDVVCYVQPIADVDENKLRQDMAAVAKTMGELPTGDEFTANGIGFHPIYLPAIPVEAARGKGWAELGPANLPPQHRGIAHWMVVNKGGGGQAMELGDMGGCGADALWAVFLHEFGHQLGLDHTGHWGPAHCPIYTSLMNYAYSYYFDDRPDAIHFSRGALSRYVLDESNLDETMPFPYEQVKFLEKGPYRFRLKPAGKETLIDWNWNGVFGEKGVRADVNYGYSTHAGIRHTIDKAHTSPFLLNHNGQAIIVYGKLANQPKPGEPPSISAEHPGDVQVRVLLAGRKWSEPFSPKDAALTSDPCAYSAGEDVVVICPTATGARAIVLRVDAGQIVQVRAEDVSVAPGSQLSAANLGTRPTLFARNPETGDVSYAVWKSGRLSQFEPLSQKSTNPVGACLDTLSGEVIVALAQDQDKDRPARWKLVRYAWQGDSLQEVGSEWVEGEAGGARGDGRMTIVFDASRDGGPKGRVYVFSEGLRRNPNAMWGQMYVAHTIADKSLRGGWLVKRMYDEWTNTRSSCTAIPFEGDILWAYRWVDGGQGPTDSDLQVAYRGLGIDEVPMGDHDDIGFVLRFGLRRSILWLNPGP